MAVTFCSVNVDFNSGVTTGVKDLRNGRDMLIVAIVGYGESIPGERELL